MRTVWQGTDERGEIAWNPVLLDFARYWSFRPRLCRPYRAQTKGKQQYVAAVLHGIGPLYSPALLTHTLSLARGEIALPFRTSSSVKVAIRISRAAVRSRS